MQISQAYFQALIDIESSRLHHKLGYPTMYNFLCDFLAFESEEALILIKSFILKKYTKILPSHDI